MEFKGTKGKWIVREEKSSNGFINIDLPNKRFFTFYGELKKINDPFTEETKANALLISKAPEMLEMLEIILQSENTPIVHRKKVKQLIKEATEL